MNGRAHSERRGGGGAAGARAARGFTLIELLVVIAVIAMLIGILLPAIGNARKAAKQARELSAIRQLLIAYTVYAGENKDRLAPGYLRGTWARTTSGFVVHDNPNDASDASRLVGSTIRPYTWRLMAQMNYQFEGLVTDKGLMSRLRALAADAADPEGFQAIFARHPSFGMNTTYVGGDAHRGAFYVPSYLRWGAFHVVRMDQAVAPSALLVFASARGVRSNSGGMKEPGYHRIEGPWRATPTSNSVPAFIPWPATSGSYDPDDPTSTYGHLDFRYSNRAVTAMFDGHAGTDTLEQLRDMRRWSNKATSAHWHP